MKKLPFLLTLLLLIGVLAPVQATEPLLTWTLPTPSTPLVIAHRGASSLAPENTLAAVEKALELNVDVVEIDVHRTYDGELVVLHDDTVDRTTSGTGKIADLTLDEVKSLDAGSWFDPSFKDERIPTLREVLETTRDRAILLIELKGIRTEVPTVEMVQEMGLSDQVIIQSFDFQQIQKSKKKAPEIPTIFLMSKPNHSSNPKKAANWIANIAEYVNADGIAIRHNWYTEELHKTAQTRELAMFVWTVDDKEELAKFRDAKLHGIITNRPQDLLELLPAKR